MIKNSEVAVGDSPQKDDYENFAAEFLTPRQFEPDYRPSGAERCIVEWLNGAIAPPGKSPVRMALLLIQLSPGDDINRGPDSCGAIETRWELPAQCGLVPILGRHPALMIESRDDWSRCTMLRLPGRRGHRAILWRQCRNWPDPPSHLRLVWKPSVLQKRGDCRPSIDCAN